MENKVSMFMLERHRLGELDSQDTVALNKILADDESLHSLMEQLDESDRELRLRYPDIASLGLGENSIGRRKPRLPNRSSAFPLPGKKKMRFAGLAAFIAAGIFLPLLYAVFSLNGGIKAQNTETPQLTDRPKGEIQADLELLIFLMGSGNAPLPDQTLLEEGNTVQLAYTVPAGKEYYGVIFSVDGRSAITMHYPYRTGQSFRLGSGGRTLLNEAYTLDDAPGYEVFVMAVFDEPPDTETVMRKARETALNNSMSSIITASKTVFDGSIVKTVTVLKK